MTGKELMGPKPMLAVIQVLQRAGWTTAPRGEGADLDQQTLTGLLDPMYTGVRTCAERWRPGSDLWVSLTPGSPQVPPLRIHADYVTGVVFDHSRRRRSEHLGAGAWLELGMMVLQGGPPCDEVGPDRRAGITLVLGQDQNGSRLAVHWGLAAVTTGWVQGFDPDRARPTRELPEFTWSSEAPEGVEAPALHSLVPTLGLVPSYIAA